MLYERSEKSFIIIRCEIQKNLCNNSIIIYIDIYFLHILYLTSGRTLKL